MTWSMADHDHLIFAMGEVENLAFESIRENDPGRRKELAQILRGKLETAREIQYVAQNAANYVALKLAALEQR